MNRVESMLELVQLPKEYATRYPQFMSGSQLPRVGMKR